MMLSKFYQWEDTMQVPLELKLNYLSRRVQDLQDLRESLEKNDFSIALKLGHQVKGNASTFEFPQMAHLGIQMEQAAKLEDKASLNQLATKMETAINNAQAMFQGQFPLPMG
jgi:HPt (histidine-containing phosphotransfer) domain-containing protein